MAQPATLGAKASSSPVNVSPEHEAPKTSLGRGNVQMLVERIKIDSIMSKLEVELSASGRLWRHILDP